MMKLMMKLLEKKQRVASDGGKKVIATKASYTHALASIPTRRSPEWIVDSGASRHVTGASTEFSFYHHLTVPGTIHTADGTT